MIGANAKRKNNTLSNDKSLNFRNTLNLILKAFFNEKNPNNINRQDINCKKIVFKIPKDAIGKRRIINTFEPIKGECKKNKLLLKSFFLKIDLIIKLPKKETPKKRIIPINTDSSGCEK